ncbi:peptide deformylase [Microbacterium sp. HSID17254]|uniref:peptide deformylase n=1 Tax=Microbacterium sp. HSID17254 TaxID=2419509 RepID=UPI000F85B9CE|nr:peptide deformylase [Microbacterium sp. HSID17254]RUQ02138.1 peptide deformylase [Microbacterium sp. HSID17254]
MTVLRIRMVGDPVLHTPPRPVVAVDDALRTLVGDMFETMAAAHGVGLAANQVGVDLRLFVFDCPDEETRTMRRGLVVDPVLETDGVPEVMPDADEDQEGCLPVPGENFATGRAQWALFTGTDLAAEPVPYAGSGVSARCLQHESDHLDGHLYLDRLMGRHQRAAKKRLKRNGWVAPSDSWDPSAVEAEEVPRG